MKGDITRADTDAIVNAANSSLLGGGGVDGAIHRAAGPELLEYCRGLNGCETGHCKSTPGFKLLAKYIIHTVGPIWKGGNEKEAELLASCYENSIREADRLGVESIAFPAVSCGIYKFPKVQATEIALSTCVKSLQFCENLRRLVFVLFDEEMLEVYMDVISIQPAFLPE